MMTDEERAWAISEDLGPCDSERVFWRDRLLEWATAIRTDQREIDAGIADRQRRALPTPQTSPEAAGTYAFNNGCSSAAAAIRKGGET